MITFKLSSNNTDLTSTFHTIQIYLIRYESHHYFVTYIIVHGLLTVYLYLKFFPKIVYTNTFINDLQKLYTKYPNDNIFI